MDGLRGFWDKVTLCPSLALALRGQKRYSPAECIGCKLVPMIGEPDPAHVSTSFVDGTIFQFA